MIAPLAAKLQIHEEELEAEVEPRGQLVAMPGVGRRALQRDTNPGVEAATWSSVLRRQMLQRRLLAAADIIAVALTVLLSLNVHGPRRVVLVAIALPFVIVLFKIA